MNEDQEMNLIISNYLKARAAITDYLKATGQRERNISGVIPCPVCDKGFLGFFIASNGHCHAQCNTADCMDWIE